jgi:hydrogenase maturation protease
MSSAADRVLVVGVGNTLAGDDAAGLLVAGRLCGRAELDVRAHDGDPTALIHTLAGARVAIVVDALRSGALPGETLRWDAGERPLPAQLRSSTSTHGFGLADTIELMRALGRLPTQLIVYGIEGECYEPGTAPSPAVTAAVDSVAEQVLAEARRRDR